ncbi:MAG: tRNA 4-thiouridine(8) synthase ThiI [Deltaproteobacteria bacterium]|nr:tRNA 4-thiouridine(8) synthase ThiI [Deltaproteobacteria bacterium]
MIPQLKLVVHYAEVGLKGRNRPRFEKTLCENLVRALAPLGRARARRLYGRILLEAPEGAELAAIAARLERVFGVAYFSVATTFEPTREAITAAVDAYVGSRSFTSFGVRVRRIDKALPFRSNELAGELGARIAGKTGARVDLTSPELWVDLHLLHGEAILLHERIAGPGGLPVGCSGRALALVSGGIDSPVAAWLLAKRGCQLSFVHFHSAPWTSDASQRKVRDALTHLAAWTGPADLFMVPFAELQQTIVRDAPAEPRIVLYRRFMVRIAEAIAERVGALALVTGDSVGQVSSQTLANLDTINRAATLPVLRPLVGSDKGEIIDLAKRIGTYEISIEPGEDCCSFLMPRQPATWTRPGPIEAIEQGLDVKMLVEATLSRVDHERIEPS